MSKNKPPFWVGQIWYTHEQGYLVKHQNEGKLDEEGIEEDPSFCWRPGYDDEEKQ